MPNLRRNSMVDSASISASAAAKWKAADFVYKVWQLGNCWELRYCDQWYLSLSKIFLKNRQIIIKTLFLLELLKFNSQLFYTIAPLNTYICTRQNKQKTCASGHCGVVTPQVATADRPCRRLGDDRHQLYPLWECQRLFLSRTVISF